MFWKMVLRALRLVRKAIKAWPWQKRSAAIVRQVGDKQQQRTPENNRPVYGRKTKADHRQRRHQRRSRSPPPRRSCLRVRGSSHRAPASAENSATNRSNRLGLVRAAISDVIVWIGDR